jgi:ATP-dependent RNA helicase RhlE
LAKELLNAPILIEVARRNAPADLVTHQVYEVAAPRKRALLEHLIRTRDMQQVLVFVRMKRDANKLVRELVRDGINATAIHSDRTQAERMQALDEFKTGKASVLVATDIAARGLDIEELPFVVNYELPYTPEDYVHRIGRTGRAGMPGEAISLVSPDEVKLLADIEKLLKRTIPRVTPERFDSAPQRERHQGGARDRAPSTPNPKPQRMRAADGFDFSKPYEPATPSDKSESAEDRESSTPLRIRPQRPTAALLGGGPVKPVSPKK